MASNYAIILKIVLVSTGIISMAVATQLSVPIIQHFVLNQVPLFWNFTLSCLRPPYLYILFNCIILTIVASSKLQTKVDKSSSPPHLQGTTVLHPVVVSSDVAVPSLHENDVVPKVGIGRGVVPPTEFGSYVYDSPEEATDSVPEEKMVRMMDDGDEDDYVISRSEWTPPVRQDSLELVLNPTTDNGNQKPPVSSRFRKPLRASPEAGKALKVTKPKRHETLESTWKTITEGRPMPLTRHLRKSETWEMQGRHQNSPSSDKENRPIMKKSETFNKGNSSYSLQSPSPGSGKLKREPSLSQDELNRRVEAFIKKFNEEMKMQRQESLKHYHEMIRRGGES